MRKIHIHATALLIAVGLLSACSSGSGGGTPSGSPSSSASPTPSVSSAPGGTSAGTPAPDAETSIPAPSPESSLPPSCPGQGNAELAITVKPSGGDAGVNYTLVCQNGVAANESKHPSAQAACGALKDNAALLDLPAKNTGQACTQQYGGPQQATVSGMVDGAAVDATFARTNGCEISAWNAAATVLGNPGGAQ